MSLKELTPEQRQAALDKAKETRVARAAIRADLKTGQLSPDEAMERINDPIVGRIKVSAFIRSLPGFGKAKAEKVMAEMGIMENRRLGGLGPVSANPSWSG